MDAMTTAECLHVYQHSRLQSESFTPEAVTAAYRSEEHTSELQSPA